MSVPRKFPFFSLFFFLSLSLLSFSLAHINMSYRYVYIYIYFIYTRTHIQYTCIYIYIYIHTRCAHHPPHARTHITRTCTQHTHARAEDAHRSQQHFQREPAAGSRQLAAGSATLRAIRETRTCPNSVQPPPSHSPGSYERQHRETPSGVHPRRSAGGAQQETPTSASGRLAESAA